MVTLSVQDCELRRNRARLAIELFLYELAEDFRSPDQWQLAAADRAVAAYQRGDFDQAFACINVEPTSIEVEPISTELSLVAAIAGRDRLTLHSVWTHLREPFLEVGAA